jgi:hypothetical protein
MPMADCETALNLNATIIGAGLLTAVSVDMFILAYISFTAANVSSSYV